MCSLVQLFAYAVSDRPLYGMVPEIKDFVKLVQAMLKAGTLKRGGEGPTDLYNLICKSQYLRIDKIAKFKLLQEYGLCGALTTIFLDAWVLDQPEGQAGVEYAALVGEHLLKKEGKGKVSFATMLASLTSLRVVWGEGADARNFTLPPNVFTEHDFFLNLEAVRQQLPSLVNAALPGFIENKGDEDMVRD